MLAETTPRPSESQQETKRNFEEQNFTNALFRVEFYQRKQNFSAVVELKLSPPMDANGLLLLLGFVECPILFRMSLKGKWA